MKNLITISLLALVVIFNSCKKEEETKTDLLCGKYWVMSEATVDPSIPIVDDYGNITGYTNNLFAQMDPCDKDNVQKYNSDGTYIWDARVKCDVGDIQSGTGTWMFNSEETVITETQNNQSMSSTIIELSKNKYKLSYEMVLYNVNYTLTITFIPE